MSRTPLDILQADPSFLIYARCDGEKIEQVVAHNAVYVLKEITEDQALQHAYELIGFVQQMRAKRAREK